MSLDGNESVILWCCGSVVLVPIPQLPPNPACSAAQPPLPPPPPAHPTDLLRRLQVPLCPTEQIRGGGEKKQPTKQAVRSGHPLTAPRQRGTTSAPHTPAMGKRDVTPPPPHLPNSHSLPTAAHEVAQHHTQHRSHRQRHQQRHQESRQQILGGGRGGGLEIPASLQHPGPPHQSWCRGGGQHPQLERRGRSMSGMAWVVGGCGVDLTRVRLHQRMAKWGAKVS